MSHLFNGNEQNRNRIVLPAKRARNFTLFLPFMRLIVFRKNHRYVDVCTFWSSDLFFFWTLVGKIWEIFLVHHRSITNYLTYIADGKTVCANVFTNFVSKPKKTTKSRLVYYFVCTVCYANRPKEFRVWTTICKKRDDFVPKRKHFKIAISHRGNEKNAYTRMYTYIHKKIIEK